MMPNKVVSIKKGADLPAMAISAEVWHGEINQRLATIERILRKLEWQVWSLFCGGATVAVLYLIDQISTR